MQRQHCFLAVEVIWFSSFLDIRALVALLEEARAQIEPDGSHRERRHQNDTTKQGDQYKRMESGLRLCSFARQDPGNDRIHGNLLVEINATLPDRRFKSFSRVKKMVSRRFRG
jgi:hypothetical protein